MRFGRVGKIVLVLVVVAIIVIAYMSVVGAESEKEPIGPTDDPMDKEREPVAYGYFTMSIGMDNEIGGYDADIRDFKAHIDYDDGTQRLAITETDKWDILGIWTDDIKVSMVCEISGPARYEALWEESYKIELSEWGYDWTDLKSGYADFWDKGEYQALVTVYADGPEYDGQVACGTYYFTV